MTAVTAPADTRARLHQLIDQIADEAVLQAALLLLLLPQANQLEIGEIEPEELSPAWQAELGRRLAIADEQIKAGQGQPWREVMDRLMNQSAA